MVFACSDIHGNYGAYMKVINKLSENDKLYIIGDVIDRGHDGIKILLDLMNRSSVEFILGNHEWMMLLSILNDLRGMFVSIWTQKNNGGTVTLDCLTNLNNNQLSSIADYLSSRKIIDSVVVNGKKYNFVHGIYDRRAERVRNMPIKDIICTIDDGDVFNGSVNFDLLWESPLKKSPINDYRSDEYYIHGHVPVIRLNKDLEPFKYKNIYFIDGGLMYGGGLILYNLTTDSYEIIN